LIAQHFFKVSSQTTDNIRIGSFLTAPHAGQPEKAQITVDEADHRYRDLRIENTLTDEHCNDVKLKKGAHVEVAVTAEPKGQ